MNPPNEPPTRSGNRRPAAPTALVIPPLGVGVRVKWLYPTFILCVYGFFSMMKPAEPYLTLYLVAPSKNFTVYQVANQMFPVWTYSFLVLLIPVLLTTDYFRYKPIIVLQGFSLVINYVLLLFAKSMSAMLYLQVNNGLVSATEVGYFSYIYSVVSPTHYRKVTSYCRSVTLVAYMVGSAMAQLLVSLGGASYFHLNAISLATMSIAFLTSFILPMPSKFTFFKVIDQPPSRRIQSNSSSSLQIMTVVKGNSENTVIPEGFEIDIKESVKTKEKLVFLRVLIQLWYDFKVCYSSKALIYWSFWWAMSTCGYYQVFNYVQVLWNNIEPSTNSSVYNGAVEAATTLVGAVLSFGVGYITLDWAIWGELALGFFSGVSSISLFIMDCTDNILICYTGYMIFKASYMLLITIATFQIASNLHMQRYALMFGINNCLALILQTILTIIVVDSRGIHLLALLFIFNIVLMAQS
uniref:Solute carrier family 19 member 3b n=1 Tax=Callorhinchus milii TaxID=7868 RepID=A0A4W3HXY9_CALMI